VRGRWATAFLLLGAVMNRRKRRVEASGLTKMFCDRGRSGIYPRAGPKV
jgi:hypothetical protein